MKYTTTSLIEILKKFPKDLPIETQLAFMWNYPDELLDKQDKLSNDDFKELTMKHATDLCIFEGSWEKGNVSDVDNKLKEYQKVRE